jgi:hypothetical protein
MEVARVNMPPILPDNDLQYITLLQSLLSSIDPSCTLEITGKLGGYSFRIAPSDAGTIQSILEDLKSFNTLLGIRVEFGKSIRTNLTISYEILNN